MDHALFLKALAALFAIMSPIANLPVFLSLTSDKQASERRSIALLVLLSLTVGCVIVLVAGNAILKLFGISVEAFRLAGGFLILLISLKLISGEQSKSHSGTEAEQEHHEQQENPAIYPLTIPMLLGPGTISTLMIFRAQATTFPKLAGLILATAVSIGLIGATFLLASQMGRFLGQTSTSVMSRLMGMILAAIAMEMMISSIKSLLPGLAG